jgi:anti-sigma28 factor (negative regulator of flagellin synthesis)
VKVKEPNDIARVNEVSTRRVASRAGKPDAEAQDRVSLPASKEFKEGVESARRSLDGARTAEVAALEAAVKRGDYSINPRRIAQRILEAAELNASITAMLKR